MMEKIDLWGGMTIKNGSCFLGKEKKGMEMIE